MELKERTFEDNRMEFVVIAIEASAKRLGIPARQMYERLSAVGLVDKLLFDCYGAMHTQSIKHIAEDVANALITWERKFKK